MACRFVQAKIEAALNSDAVDDGDDPFSASNKVSDVVSSTVIWCHLQ
jgi:hypothetical protein